MVRIEKLPPRYVVDCGPQGTLTLTIEQVKEVAAHLVKILADSTKQAE